MWGRGSKIFLGGRGWGSHGLQAINHNLSPSIFTWTYLSVCPWKLYRALARNWGLLAALLAASSSSFRFLATSASYSLLSRSSSSFLLNLSSSSCLRLNSSSSLRLRSSSSLLLRAASSSLLLKTSSSEGGCCLTCSSSDAVLDGTWAIRTTNRNHYDKSWLPKWPRLKVEPFRVTRIHLLLSVLTLSQTKILIRGDESKENDHKSKKLLMLDFSSLSVPWEMHKEQYGEYATWC